MLRLATLGLLQQEPMNGYRLKQQLELFMGCIICVNYGAIYPLLKRMEEQSEIMLVDDETGESPQNSKTYAITDLGRDRWREEMLSHPQDSWVNSRSRFLIKFFFFSQLQPSERVQLLEHRLMLCRLRLTQKLAEPSVSDPYQVTFRQRSLDTVNSEISWLTQQLAKELEPPVEIAAPAKKRRKPVR